MSEMSAPQKKHQCTLVIESVSVAMLERIKELGAAQRPPVTRNAMILFVVEEVAAGRNPLASLQPISHPEPAELAAA